MPVSPDPKENIFLEKVAKKLGRPTPSHLPVREAAGPPDFWLNSKMSSDELIKEFVDNAEKLTIKINIVQNVTEIQSQISQWLKELNAKYVICWDSPELKEAMVSEVCTSLGISMVTWNNREDRSDMIKRCAQVDVGITWADYGIANTGSLAILSSPEQSRSVSLVPPVHIAILYKDSILPHMGDIFNRLDKNNLPSSLNFITGPSRTSDIEMDLTLGVHGPGKVFIIIVNKQ